MDIMPIVISITVFGSIKIQAIGLQPHRWKYLERIMYEISFVETEEQLKQVLDFCYNILYCTPVEFAVQSLEQHLRDAENYRYEDWKERLENDNKLLVYAHENGHVISAVLGRRETAESLVCGFAACEAGHRRQGITGRLMDRFEEEANRAGFRYITLGSDADGFYEKCGCRKICETEGQNIYQKLL